MAEIIKVLLFIFLWVWRYLANAGRLFSFLHQQNESLNRRDIYSVQCKPIDFDLNICAETEGSPLKTNCQIEQRKNYICIVDWQQHLCLDCAYSLFFGKIEAPNKAVCIFSRYWITVSARCRSGAKRHWKTVLSLARHQLDRKESRQG